MKRPLWAAVLCLMGLAAIFIWTLQEGEEAHHSEEELRLASVFARIDGAGACEVFLYEAAASGFEQQGHRGMMILCEGGANLSTVIKIQQAAHTLTGIPIESIDIYSSEH